MVTHNPGEWFEETLQSIAATEYPDFATLVVDAASDDPEAIEAMVASVLPDAHVRRLSENPGYGAAANEAMVAVQGASFYLFCHDDVRLDPDALRLLVEEAFRSNAGVVGPKLVDWFDPQRLLSVGMGADRFGFPAPYVERGDLDQEQHDAVRDVFYIEGGATLVRADLFAAIGGHDPAITYHGDDLDLGWRAHLAGARVVVAPAAVVAHREALGVRRPTDDRRRLQARHRLRVMRVADSFGTRLVSVPLAGLLSLLEILQSVIFGRFRRASDISSAWVWNSRQRKSRNERRKLIAQTRRLSDRELRGFQARGSARLTTYIRNRWSKSEAAAGGRAFVSNLRDPKTSTTFLVWLVLFVFFVLGSREVLFSGLPLIGDFVRFIGPGESFSRYFSGYQEVGLGSTGWSPTGFGLLGTFGTVLLGAVGLLRTLLTICLWPLGVLGVWRMTRPFGSSRPRLLSIALYVLLPLASNAISQGQWETLLAYAVMPSLVSQLLLASRLAPFGDLGDDAGPGVVWRPLWHRAFVFALLLALASAFAPAILIVAAGVTIVLALSGLFVGQLRGFLRISFVGLFGTLIALVMHLPWSLSFTKGIGAVIGVSSNGGYPLELADVLRFGNGPFGKGFVGWLPLVTAALPLLIGRRWRLGWAARFWLVAAAGFGGAWVVGQGWLVEWLPNASLLLVPAALGISLAAGLGVAAFETDLPDYHFGWRQLFSVIAAFAFLVSIVPALGTSIGGRWELPKNDFARTLSFLSNDAASGLSRVVWIGDQAALPLPGWKLNAPEVSDLGNDRQLAFATTLQSSPSIAEQWPGQLDGATTQLEDVLAIAASGGTARLGELLAPMGVRYIVVPLAPAPDPYAASRAYNPTALLTMLDAQLDLASITVNQGVMVYRNAAWSPVISQLSTSAELPSGGNSLSERIAAELTTSEPILTSESGYGKFTGDVTEPSKVYAALPGENWELTVDGQKMEQSRVFGWSSVYNAPLDGEAKLSYSTPLVHRFAMIGQILVWLLVIVLLLRSRSRIEEATNLSEKKSDFEPSEEELLAQQQLEEQEEVAEPVEREKIEISPETRDLLEEIFGGDE